MVSRGERRRRLAPSFLILASALSCGNESTTHEPAPGTDGARDPEGGPPYQLASSNDACPRALPSAGDGCSGSAVCSYQSKSCDRDGVNAKCLNDAWRLWWQDGACNPPTPECPNDPPPAGGLCFGAESCGEGACAARCAGGVWERSFPERCAAEGASGANAGGAPSVSGAGGADP